MHSTGRLIEAIRVEEIRIVEIDEKVMQEDSKLMTMSTMSLTRMLRIIST